MFLQRVTVICGYVDGLRSDLIEGYIDKADVETQVGVGRDNSRTGYSVSESKRDYYFAGVAYVHVRDGNRPSGN